MNPDWIMVDLIIPSSYHIKTTDKSICFKLWGKKFLPFPLQFMKNQQQSGGSWSLQMPAWFIAKHSLRSLVEDERIRDELFPTKTILKKRELEQREQSLFNQPIPAKVSVDIEKTHEAQPVQGDIPF